MEHEFEITSFEEMRNDCVRFMTAVYLSEDIDDTDKEVVIRHIKKALENLKTNNFVSWKNYMDMAGKIWAKL